MVGPSSEAIRALVEPALSSSGLELWDVELSRDIVRVLVDRPGGIDLDSLASVAGRVVSPLLDQHPELTPEGTYQLEVSSPGVERTLHRPEHYQRYVGAEISVKTSVPVDGARRHHGNLLDVDLDAGRIRIAPKDGPAGSVVEIPLQQVERARTVLVWGPAPKPTKKGAVKRPAAPDPGNRPVASRTRTKD